MTEITFVGQSGTEWKYYTDQALGKGGFGAVYAAGGPDGRPMAVKVVSKQRPSGTLDDRLLRREIDIGRRVRDSGGDMLLPVIDAAETSRTILLVMPRAGHALSTALPMPELAGIAAMTDIATGLQQLHLAGIIHRDLKPPNVLQHNGRWKLADFGIARDEEIGTQDPTFIGAGSLPYMAPELWQLRSPTVKSDLYALGCLGFELLTGTPPYTGDLMTLRTAHLTQPPPEPPYSNPTVKNLISRLLAKDPADRPQDARAVLDRLQRAALPRTPEQEGIARALGTHQAERSRAAAEAAAAAAAAHVRDQQITQGKADLFEIFSDALEDLQVVEPDAALHALRNASERFEALKREFNSLQPHVADVRLSVAGIALQVDIWHGATTDEPVPGDSMLIAGQADISNPRHTKPLNCANIVYEQVGDRYAWQVYRFHSSGLIPAGSYDYGPYSRTHGLERSRFLATAERFHMLYHEAHAWNVAVELLTAGNALKLFREAADLR